MDITSHSAEKEEPLPEMGNRSTGGHAGASAGSASEKQIVEKFVEKRKQRWLKASTGGSAGSKGLFVEPGPSEARA